LKTIEEDKSENGDERLDKSLNLKMTNQEIHSAAVDSDEDGDAVNGLVLNE